MLVITTRLLVVNTTQRRNAMLKPQLTQPLTYLRKARMSSKHTTYIHEFHGGRLKLAHSRYTKGALSKTQLTLTKDKETNV